VKRIVILLAGAGLVAAALVTEESMGILNVGERAPRFTAVLSTGESVSLGDYLGKQTLVLFFYPKDETAGCIAEVCSYRDNYEEIRGFGAAILGVSFDGRESHDRFIAHHRLPFPLIADTGRTLSRLYGAVRWGGPWPRAKRVTYVIDRDGIIRGVIRHELRTAKHSADVLAVLRGM
jgi:peroxiredoxin Q/BCP